MHWQSTKNFREKYENNILFCFLIIRILINIKKTNAYIIKATKLPTLQDMFIFYILIVITK